MFLNGIHIIVLLAPFGQQGKVAPLPRRVVDGNLLLLLADICLVFFHLTVVDVWLVCDVGLVYNVEARVFSETFGHHDALGSLVVFKQCRHDAWQSQCRSVERVA